MNFTPRPDLPIDLAGLAQAMVALASEIADDIVLWGCPASYVRDVIVPTVRDARSGAGKDADSFATVAALAFLRGIGRRRVRIWAIWVGSNFVRLWVGADQVSDSEDQKGAGTADEQLTCPGA